MIYDKDSAKTFESSGSLVTSNESAVPQKSRARCHWKDSYGPREPRGADLKFGSIAKKISMYPSYIHHMFMYIYIYMNCYIQLHTYIYA